MQIPKQAFAFQTVGTPSECIQYGNGHINLMGDVYFRTHYPEQNLVRCRTQFALLKDMLTKWEEMDRIVAKIAKEIRG